MNPLKSLIAAAWLAAGSSAAIAQPADADPLGWFTESSGGRLELAYGEPDTDNIAITFFCRPGEGAVHVQIFSEVPGDDERPMGSSWETSFDLLSGATQGEYRAIATMTETGPLIADARIPVDDPVIQAFRRSGLLTAHHNPISAETQRERRIIQLFLDTCG